MHKNSPSPQLTTSEEINMEASASDFPPSNTSEMTKDPNKPPQEKKSSNYQNHSI
jgi:hypothetical protein